MLFYLAILTSRVWFPTWRGVCAGDSAVLVRGRVVLRLVVVRGGGGADGGHLLPVEAGRGRGCAWMLLHRGLEHVGGQSRS